MNKRGRETEKEENDAIIVVTLNLSTSSTATRLQISRNEVTRNCIAIRLWEGKFFLSSSSKHTTLEQDLFEDGTGFTIDIHNNDTRFARILNHACQYLRVDPMTHEVTFAEKPEDENDPCILWKLQCVGKKSPRGLVGANLLESVRLPEMYLKINGSLAFCTKRFKRTLSNQVLRLMWFLFRHNKLLFF